MTKPDKMCIRDRRKNGSFLLNTIWEGDELAKNLPNKVKKYFACLLYTSFYSPQTQAVQPTHANRTAHVWRLYVTQLWAINLTPFKADY